MSTRFFRKQRSARSQMGAVPIAVRGGSLAFPGHAYALFKAANVEGLSTGDPLPTWVNSGDPLEGDAVTAITSPTWWSTGGPEGGPIVDFSAWGATDRMDCPLSLGAKAQPGIEWAVFRYTAAPQTLIGSNAGTARWNVQILGAGDTQIADGAAFHAGTALSTATWYWIIGLFNNTSSEIRVSEGTIAFGTCGTQNSNNFRIGNNPALNQGYTGDLAEVGGCNDGTTIDAVEAYLRANYPSI